jgi:ATP-dependent helicase STH1/SNF2
MRTKGIPATDPSYLAITKVIKAQQQLLITLQNMTPEQREQAKAQQSAYRHLTRNVPAPEDALKTIKKDPSTPSAKPATPTKHVSTAPVSISNNGVTLGLIPMDAAFIIQERENRIQNRMKQRLEELRVLYPMLPDEMRIDALIEIKQLELFEMQKRVRTNILEEFQRNANSLQSASDRALYKRPRTFFAPEVVPTERTERQKREEQQMNKARRRNDLVSAVTSHARAFKDFHANNNLLIKKVNKQVIKYVQHKEKKEQLQRERDEKERLQALKANDEEAYIKLLEKAKNDRLRIILDQTDKYLKEIGAAVEREQETIDGVAGPVDAEMDEDAMLPSSKSRGNKTYYMNIHKIQEEITEQPAILVGGKLKEYQMAGLSWLVSLYNNRMNGILADEMGLGKTIQTISLLCYLFESKGTKGPFMVVAPLA